jgi:hypothetical protein
MLLQRVLPVRLEHLDQLLSSDGTESGRHPDVVEHPALIEQPEEQ